MAEKSPSKAKPATPEATKTVIEAGPVAVQVDSGALAVVVAPPARAGIDRRLFTLINGLPHSATSDRYVSVLSDLGEGLGWVTGGVVLALLGGPKGQRAGVATAVASLAATYVVSSGSNRCSAESGLSSTARHASLGSGRPTTLFHLATLHHPSPPPPPLRSSIRRRLRSPTRWLSGWACPGCTSECTFQVTQRSAE